MIWDTVKALLLYVCVIGFSVCIWRIRKGLKNMEGSDD